MRKILTRGFLLPVKKMDRINVKYGQVVITHIFQMIQNGYSAGDNWNF